MYIAIALKQIMVLKNLMRHGMFYITNMLLKNQVSIANLLEIRGLKKESLSDLIKLLLMQLITMVFGEEPLALPGSRN